MATVKLSDYECERGFLPYVCMFCGRQAVTRVKQKFQWHHPWIFLLILVSVLVYIIVALVLTKKMVVRVPACDQHEGYWRRKGWRIGLSFVVIAGLAVAGIVYLTSLPPGPADELSGWICGGGVILFLIWLIAACVYSSVGIRPTEITDASIRLTGVHDDFVAALREERALYREEGGRRRNRYGDERDDYDELDEEDPPPRPRRTRDDWDEDDRRRRRDDD